MAWDSVPWFVGGGAQHSPEVARLLAYAATSGAEGIVDVGDLKVSPLAVPGGSVRVSPGAAIIRDRTSGAGNQSYVARMATEDTIAVSPTGSGGGRSDLVVARIEDPFVAGAPWQDPTDPTVGPYVYTRIIPNVPAGTKDVKSLNLGYSAIPLARIDLPASTGTVQASHIVDLRKVARPRRDRQLRTTALSQGNTDALTIYSPIGNERWPDVTYTLDIPEWATAAKVIATWSGVQFPPGNSYGSVFVLLGYQDPGGDVRTQTVRYDTPGATNNSRATIVLADDVVIPAHLRGKSVVCELVGTAEGGTQAAQPILDWASAISLDIEFVEKAE